jgi:hypothetical protein
MATAALVETLVLLDRAAEAKERAERALSECARRELGASCHEIIRALALAESKLGDHAAAGERLDALLEAQRALGITGLNLGLSYEARARVAIAASDHAGVERFAQLTAEQYRHGRGSMLGARYERLMAEARSAGVAVLPALSAFESKVFSNTELGTRSSTIASIAESMSGATNSAERALRGLRLLCDSVGARGGHLFLGSERDLQLAASYSADAPDDALERAVADFWSQQFDDLDIDTAQVLDDESTQGCESQRWIGASGTVYQSLLVSGKVGHEFVHAGVALLIEDGVTQSTATSTRMVAELAGFLVRSRMRAQ